MGSIYDLKPKFQSLLRPVLSFLVRKKFTPNTVTIIALIGSGVVGGVVGFCGDQPVWLLLLPVWLFLRMALNAIDGMMAREYDMATDSGAVLNELGDVISDCLIYLPLAIVDRASFWPVVVFCIGAVVTEFCGVLGKSLGASRHYEGPMGKSDRAFLVGALAVLTAFLPQIFVWWKWIFVIAAVMTVWTCKNRICKALLELEETKQC